MLLLFTDLDDTLFTSARKAAPTPAHVPLAYLKDGAPISYASPCQQALLAHWQAHATMIPVTARNLDAYRRVRIPFTAHAVINHGGVILLPDGSADPAWLAQSRANAAQSVAGLEALAAHLPATAALNTRLMISPRWMMPPGACAHIWAMTTVCTGTATTSLSSPPGSTRRMPSPICSPSIAPTIRHWSASAWATAAATCPICASATTFLPLPPAKLPANYEHALPR